MLLMMFIQILQVIQCSLLQSKTSEESEVEKFGLDAWVTDNLSSWFSTDFMGMEYWRWVAIAIVIAIGFAVDIIVRFILRSILRSITHADKHDIELVQFSPLKGATK